MHLVTVMDAHASDPRATRLALATVLVCTSLALACTFALVLERMVVSRVSGPRSRIDFAAATIAEPPKPAPPRPPPDVDEGDTAATNGVPALLEHTPTIVEDARPDSVRAEAGGEGDSEPGIPGPAIPGRGSPCLGPMCGKSALPGLPIGAGGGTCVGPQCGSGKRKPPKPLAFDAMHCIACPDPSDAALRKTSAGQLLRGGTNVTSFCVDERGRVEASSVETERSHGDPTIDRLCREAVEDWRFSPSEVDGEARRACSRATFRIRFE